LDWVGLVDKSLVIPVRLHLCPLDSLRQPVVGAHHSLATYPSREGSRGSQNTVQAHPPAPPAFCYTKNPFRIVDDDDDGDGDLSSFK
jgi:hypothetical protein